MLKFKKEMQDAYIKEVLKFHFRRREKGIFSIEGQWNCYIVRVGDSFYEYWETEDGKEHEGFIGNTYKELVKFLRYQLNSV